MNSAQLTELIRYRMEQAAETLHEAEILYAQNALRGTINRAYYAMFYALLGLLATQQLGTSKHSGALSLFDQQFVKTGIFPRELSKNLRMAFELRQTYDYGEKIALDPKMTAEMIANAKQFILMVEAYLRSHNYFTTP